MRKPVMPSQPAQRRRKTPRAAARQKAAIAATLNDMNHMQPGTPKAVKVLSLLKLWLKDDSGYDERTWPKLKQSLDEQRVRVVAARLFDEITSATAARFPPPS
jgi:hypothetical protein